MAAQPFAAILCAMFLGACVSKKDAYISPAMSLLASGPSFAGTHTSADYSPIADLSPDVALPGVFPDLDALLGAFDVSPDLTGWHKKSGATGTANGYSFTYKGAIDHRLSDVNGGFNGFSEGTTLHRRNTDALHIWDQGKFTFDKRFDGVYIYVAMNPDHQSGPDLVDFGVKPTVVSGDVFVKGNGFGTKSLSGGIVHLDISGKSLQFTSPIDKSIPNTCADFAILPYAR